MTKIDHPEYYQGHEFECIDFIEDHNLNFNLGNAIKYLTRAGRKKGVDAVTDLEKAKWYVKREWTTCGNRINRARGHCYNSNTGEPFYYTRINNISTVAYIMDQHLDWQVGDIIESICDEGDLSKAIALINDLLNLNANPYSEEMTYESKEEANESH